MNRKKQINLKILPNGEIKAEIAGFQGTECLDYISVLERLLDAETIDSKRTPEYYLTEQQNLTDCAHQSVPMVYNQEK